MGCCNTRDDKIIESAKIRFISWKEFTKEQRHVALDCSVDCDGVIAQAEHLYLRIQNALFFNT